jgi:hypothetical protein
MARSTMAYWVQTCPDCGYCAADIAKADSDISSIVRSRSYQLRLTAPYFPQLANRFLCQALIHEMSGSHLAAANVRIYAAWCCDDAALPEQATYCRSGAIESIEKAKRHKYIDRSFGMKPEVMIDLFRRSGRFAEASELLRSVIDEKTDYLSLRVLRFQQRLIERQDTGGYNLQAATGKIDSARAVCELAHYLASNCGDLLTAHERQALNATGCINEEGEHWLIDDANVQSLLADGIETLAVRIAERLESAHPDKVIINRCPKCNALARTARAKQCWRCYYDWH